MASSQSVSIRSTLRRWWSDGLARDGFWTTAKKFASALREFLRESTPARRRQSYGDADYDWDYHVNTTSATVSWRDRLLGHFHSPYQPTEPALFKEMMASLEINFQEFTFIDVGSGKGRALLMAADYPFRRILGVELLPDLHRVAQENISRYKSDSQQCFVLEAICGDARQFVFPLEPMVLYLFNPLPEPALVEFVASLDGSLRENPRATYLLYHNPLLEGVLMQSSALKKIAGTHQYSAFTNDVRAEA
jgi:SAM-dependent methyltransferase